MASRSSVIRASFARVQIASVVVFLVVAFASLRAEARASSSEDCASCVDVIHRARAKVASPSIQSALAHKLAKACEEMTNGDPGRAGACVAAGESAIRFATRYVETHEEIDCEICRGLEMCETNDVCANGNNSNSFDAYVRKLGEEAKNELRALASAKDDGDGEMCGDCVAAMSMMENELRANATREYVMEEVDALCAQLGAELSQQCERVVEPYVPFILDSLADATESACENIGVCPKLGARNVVTE